MPSPSSRSFRYRRCLQMAPNGGTDIRSTRLLLRGERPRVGESAGGTLAAVIAQLARDSHDFEVVLQIMIYPMTDLRTDAASYDRLGTGFFLTRRKMQWFIDHYVS